MGKRIYFQTDFVEHSRLPVSYFHQKKLYRQMDHFYQKGPTEGSFLTLWNLQSSRAFNFTLILTTCSGKILTVHLLEKFILIEMDREKLLKLESYHPKEKITFIKKDLRRAPSKVLLIWKTY